MKDQLITMRLGANISPGKIFLIILCLLSFISIEIEAVEAHNSWHHLPSSNGYCIISYNSEKKVVDRFQPYIFWQWNDSLRVPNLLDRAEFRLKFDGEEIGLSQIPLQHAEYLTGTGIIRAEHSYQSLTVVSYMWSPMILEFRVAICVLQVKNAKRHGIDGDNIRFDLRAKGNFDTVHISAYQGQDLWVAEVLLYTTGLSADMIQQIKDEVSSAKPLRLLEAEQRWWNHWHLSGRISSSIIGRKYELLLQSAAFLKMAQCQVKGPGYGQIVSSLAPGAKNSASARDMAFSIVALTKLGYFQEARDALKFMLTANGGRFETVPFKKRNLGVGGPYQISVHRYFGNGKEYSPLIKNLPILGLDSFGLFLWAVHEYVKESTDIDLLRNYWPIIDKGVAIPLARVLTNWYLVQPESGFWDSPLPGQQQVYASVAAYRGFNAAASLANILQESDRADIYSQLAAHIRKSILYHFTDEKKRIFKNTITGYQYPRYLDGTVVECITAGVSKPQWVISRFTMNEIEKNLRRKDGSGGYAANIDKQSGLTAESVFLNLRTVVALETIGRSVRARQLMNWIIDQAALNYYILPESYNQNDADYSGAVPAIGMGAAAYVVTILNTN